MNRIEKSKKMLNSWITYFRADLYTPSERPDLVCYGAGYNGWGMQTHQKGLAAYATAATTDMHTDMSKEELLDISLKMLRYMLETHLEGSYTCVEGDKWGHTWISVLGTERVMHAVDMLVPYMTKDDKRLLEKVLVSEADWLLEEYPVEAGLENASGKNKPESNLWNGAFLHRVSSMYPTTGNAERYRKKANVFLLNSISIAEDQHSEVVYDGDMVKELYVGSNFYDSYSLDHHGYLNLGYMVITLSNIAMYHFACKVNGYTAPQALYHRSSELWLLVKSLMFKDGRLIRIGGDTRVRYCYCQDYAIPMLLFVSDYLGDKDAEGMLSGIVDMYETEMVNNGDGSFLSDRCAGFKKLSPIYYTRLESDRAAVLSMLLCWDSYVDKNEKCVRVLNSWHEDYHGAYMVRGKKRFASWVVSGATGPLSLCLPMDHSDLAEWNYNLIGKVSGAGSFTAYECLEHNEYGFEGGFAAKGTFEIKTSNFMAEQQKTEVTAKLTAVTVALPDDATMVIMQHAVSPQRIYVMEAKGLLMNVPNDIYNDKKRNYYFDGENHMLEGLSGKEECLEIKGDYINVDDVLGIYGGYGKAYKLYRPGTRTTGIKVYPWQDKLHESNTNSFGCDLIMKTFEQEPAWKDKGAVIIDDGAVVRVDVNGKKTEELAKLQKELEAKILIKGSDQIRSIVSKGADNETYVVIVNLGNETEEIVISGGRFKDVIESRKFDGKIEGSAIKVLKMCSY